MNGRTFSIWIATTALITTFSMDALAATASSEQIRSCTTKVVFELNGVPRADISATPGSLEADGKGRVNWTSRDGRTGYCRINPDGTVADFGFDNAEITNPTPVVNAGVTATAGEKVFVATDGGALNVRRSPGGEIINTVPNRSPLVLTGQTSGEWLEIEGGGWVSKSLVANTGSAELASTSPAGNSAPTEPRDQSATQAQQAVVATGGDGLLIRSSPNGEVIGSVPSGATLTLTGQRSGEWVEIEGGWVSEAYLQYR